LPRTRPRRRDRQQWPAVQGRTMSHSLTGAALSLLQSRGALALLTLALGALLWGWQNWSYRRSPRRNLATPHRWLLGLDPLPRWAGANELESTRMRTRSHLNPPSLDGADALIPPASPVPAGRRPPPGGLWFPADAALPSATGRAREG